MTVGGMGFIPERLLMMMMMMTMASDGFYLFHYVPHLEKLGEAPQRCPHRPLIFWLTKETVLHVFI